MTSLVAVLAVDQRGPSSLYIMTDSRITWKGYVGEWDAGQKTYFSASTPHIFGFCGNASFPPSVARQLTEHLDCGVIDTKRDPAVTHAQIGGLVDWALSNATNRFFDKFSLFHGCREGDLMQSRFRLWQTEYYQSTNRTYDKEINIRSDVSCLAHIDGSGAAVIGQLKDRWKGTEAESTSRAAIWTFCEALASGTDKYTGGHLSSLAFGERAEGAGLECCGKGNATSPV